MHTSPVTNFTHYTTHEHVVSYRWHLNHLRLFTKDIPEWFFYCFNYMTAMVSPTKGQGL